ncbi:B-lymphocyte antigen CD19 [Eleutherodactylus coqui]|uniref:B-lymphocyte antigen CD19 n=1 Tax=Eleutherodactylus coqui TaxID=57060 RepID=UPI003462E30E
MVEMTPTILMLDTYIPSIVPAPSDGEDTSANYSCSVDHMASSTYTVIPTERREVPEEVMDIWSRWSSKEGSGEDIPYMFSNESNEMEWIACRAPLNWTLLQWFRGGKMIAMVQRSEVRLNVVFERDNLSFSITSFIEDGKYSCCDEVMIKKLNWTCRWPTLPQSMTGWQRFVEERYWIIVVVALSSELFCLLIMGGFISMKRRKRVRRQAKSRFFKASTAARNVYTNSINQETDVGLKDQEFTYENVSVTLSKAVSDDCYSNKSSFLSDGAGSYLEPTPEGGDQVSDGGCYENTTQDGDDHEDSLDGECYENANEKIKDGSEGSQSYEDMKGSICIRMKTEAPPEEKITQDEDADSYENMQTPLYSQANRFFNPQHKPTEDQPEGRKASVADPAAHQQPWQASTELQEEDGDFYLSYETNKL